MFENVDEISSEITDWDTVSCEGGVEAIRNLSGDEFTGVITNDSEYMFILNGRIIGSVGGSVSDFTSAPITAHKAPAPSLPLLFSMQNNTYNAKSDYYIKEKPIEEIDAVLSKNNFTGYIELAEDVYSGNYYLVYYNGKSMSVGFPRTAGRLLTGEEAFEYMKNEVGIYTVYSVNIDIIDLTKLDNKPVAEEHVPKLNSKLTGKKSTSGSSHEESDPGASNQKTSVSTVEDKLSSTKDENDETDVFGDLTETEQIIVELATNLKRKALHESKDIADSEFRAVLKSDVEEARVETTHTLFHLAKESSENVIGLVDTLGNLLDDDSEKVRHNATGTLGWVASEQPSEVRSYIDKFYENLFDDTKGVRRFSIWALAEIAEEHPTDVKSTVSDLQPLLSVDDQIIRKYVVSTLVAVADESPSDVHPMADDLGQLLSDPECSEDAAKALSALVPEYSISVQKVVEEYASGQLEEIVGEHAISRDDNTLDEDALSGDENIVTKSQPQSKSQPIPDISTVKSPSRGDIAYETISHGDIIGSGGQAIVRQANLDDDDDLPDKIAVKQPHQPGETMNKAEMDEFFHEARVWKRLDTIEREKKIRQNSEHIVGIIDIGENLPWVAMEYMDGGDLEERIADRDGGLPVEESLWIGECLCRGLQLAHDYGIAHLDLKPSNVLFRTTASEHWDVPKIADWGLARVLLEQSGSVDAISVEYAAPEQFAPEQYGDPDKYSDIYQLGAVVYAMLTGTPPYTGGQAQVMHDVVYGDDPEPVSTHRDDVPVVLDETVLKALRKEKSERYRGTVSFEDRLREIRLDM